MQHQRVLSVSYIALLEVSLWHFCGIMQHFMGAVIARLKCKQHSLGLMVANTFGVLGCMFKNSTSFKMD